MALCVYGFACFLELQSVMVYQFTVHGPWSFYNWEIVQQPNFNQNSIKNKLSNPCLFGFQQILNIDSS